MEIRELKAGVYREPSLQAFMRSATCYFNKKYVELRDRTPNLKRFDYQSNHSRFVISWFFPYHHMLFHNSGKEKKTRPGLRIQIGPITDNHEVIFLICLSL